jgi:hypothetical protein
MQTLISTLASRTDFEALGGSGEVGNFGADECGPLRRPTAHAARKEEGSVVSFGQHVEGCAGAARALQALTGAATAAAAIRGGRCLSQARGAVIADRLLPHTPRTLDVQAVRARIQLQQRQLAPTTPTHIAHRDGRCSRGHFVKLRGGAVAARGAHTATTASQPASRHELGVPRGGRRHQRWRSRRNRWLCGRARDADLGAVAARTRHGGTRARQSGLGARDGRRARQPQWRRAHRRRRTRRPVPHCRRWACRLRLTAWVVVCLCGWVQRHRSTGAEVARVSSDRERRGMRVRRTTAPSHAHSRRRAVMQDKYARLDRVVGQFNLVYAGRGADPAKCVGTYSRTC